MKKIIFIALLALASAFFYYYQHSASQAESRAMAQSYCSGCHLFPEPNILPRASWEATLGYMGYYLGVTDISYLEDTPEFVYENVESKLQYIQRENVFPLVPLINEQDWEEVRNYYLTSAPEVAEPQRNKELPQTLDQFRSLRTSYRFSPPMITTAVGIDEGNSIIHLADSYHESITTLGANGRVISGPRNFLPAVTPVKFDIDDNRIFVGSIGDLFGSSTASDLPGHIGILTDLENGIDNASYDSLISQLPRIADFLRVDLDSDGIDDFITSGFGLASGLLSVYWGDSDGSFEQNDLVARAGAVKAQAADFNLDGIMDFAVLFGDAREGLFIYQGLGNHEFERHSIFETHSAYGHTYFEVQDFNNDGLMDFLVVNGDNVDSDPYNTLKNYHGIRIFLNEGDYRFVESYFYPMYGAYRAQAADFDQDGDLDIAAIAFFPDFSLDESESFVYLESADGGYTPFFDSLANSGRWMTMDVGDINGDGFDDIVLGASYILLGMANFMDRFIDFSANGPGAVILTNLANE
jgi:hypothetical protein